MLSLLWPLISVYQWIHVVLSSYTPLHWSSKPIPLNLYLPLRVRDTHDLVIRIVALGFISGKMDSHHLPPLYWIFTVWHSGHCRTHTFKQNSHYLHHTSCSYCQWSVRIGLETRCSLMQGWSGKSSDPHLTWQSFSRHLCAGLPLLV